MAIDIGAGITIGGGITFAPPIPGRKAIFGYGAASSQVSITNLVTINGIVGNDVTGVGTARENLAATGYGGDKAIFGYGFSVSVGTNVSMTNLVSNTGVVGNDVTGVGTGRAGVAAAGYGGDKALFGFGGGDNPGVTNLIANTGVVATDTVTVGLGRSSLAAASYGTDKAIFGYGQQVVAPNNLTAITNLVSNTGVVASNTTGVGTARSSLAEVGETHSFSRMDTAMSAEDWETAYGKMTTFYARDRGEPLQIKIYIDAQDFVSAGEEYNYLFNGIEWLVNDHGEVDDIGWPVFDLLSTVLETEAA